MDRKSYISDDVLSLSEYVRAADELARYHCWLDEDTQSGFNHKATETLEEFACGWKSRFCAAIIRRSDQACVGYLSLSPEGTPPDLAIMIYPPYRRRGYATRAFSLGVRYGFETLKLEHVYAGCYPHNKASLKMLERCGFQPHPEGNLRERHYLTGKEIIQLDFVKRSANRKGTAEEAVTRHAAGSAPPR